MSKLNKRVVDISFDNMNEVLEAMRDEGQQNLDILEKKLGKFHLTNFGCLLNLKNSDGKGFYALIMDTDDMTVFRKRILKSAEGIKKNFKECA
jgi:hypothetical protein